MASMASVAAVAAVVGAEAAPARVWARAGPSLCPARWRGLDRLHGR
jgi:hypothetical protein